MIKIFRRPMFFHAADYSRDYLAYRSAGVHVMEIVEDMAVALHKEKQFDPESIATTSRETYLLGGFNWERALERELIEHEFNLQPGRLLSVGEQFWCYGCDRVFTGGSPDSPAAEHIYATSHMGIFLTPDAIDQWDACLEEWKWTWRSEKHCVEMLDDEPGTFDEHEWTDDTGEVWVPDNRMMDGAMWKWIVQGMSYARLWWLLKARYRVVFANGDYTDMRPRPWVFEAHWSRADLKDNWDDIVEWAVDKGML